MLDPFVLLFTNNTNGKWLVSFISTNYKPLATKVVTKAASGGENLNNIKRIHQNFCRVFCLNFIKIAMNNLVRCIYLVCRSMSETLIGNGRWKIYQETRRILLTFCINYYDL